MYCGCPQQCLDHIAEPNMTLDAIICLRIRAPPKPPDHKQIEG